ncbi:conjugative transposon protein TraN [Dyadobacter chenwenxiniae]|uniref:Conjugative transposon protein TraN n=1 Tax=Dyadobacter chenwenxiniae TaxID=2906456 RepID=A0A9X1PGN3_9BACT|nr:conjugative transposon protein TraN [Dyadobacter chenwenxiniae]MCF0059870.1 conjugative transposon protein TraN [Dyadobacter chenwenxiniae]UON85610.1 conjugative transposon protein TraN [Dyadobacter chenwenxiniae]
MRTFFLCQLLLCLLIITSGFCQVIETSVIESFPLEVTTDKTTHLIFPFSIKTVDRGSKDLLAQKAVGVENILQVKAARPDLNATNLTVITADGKLFSFDVEYALKPLNLNILVSPPLQQVAKLRTDAFNEAEVAKVAETAATGSGRNISIKDRSSQSELSLSGLYIEEGLLAYKIDLINNSSIRYDIENFRFFIRDRKQPKRTAVQELEVKPFHIRGDTSAVDPRSSHSFIYVLPKMTIPDKKYLSIQVQEKNGGRHLNLKVRNKHILKAAPIKQ